MKGYEDSLTGNVPGDLALGFLASKILVEQEEGLSVTTKANVHLSLNSKCHQMEGLRHVLYFLT